MKDPMDNDRGYVLTVVPTRKHPTLLRIRDLTTSVRPSIHSRTPRLECGVRVNEQSLLINRVHSVNGYRECQSVRANDNGNLPRGCLLTVATGRLCSARRSEHAHSILMMNILK